MAFSRQKTGKSTRSFSLIGLSLLALILVLTLFAGCGPSTPTAPATTAPPTTTQPPTTAEPATTEPATTAPPTTQASPTAAASPSPTVAAPANPNMILATTTSTQDSGLLDVLIPLFQEQTGYIVKTVAVGSGAAMTMGERGEADVLLVHAPPSEVTFMEAGHGIDRKLVMHNDFIFVGPEDDPAGIKDMTSAVEALKKIADSGSILSAGEITPDCFN